MKRGYILKQYKRDICLAAAVLAAAVILGFCFWNGDRGGRGNAAGMLEITVDGDLYGIYPLNRDQEINVVTSYGRNTVVIEQNAAYVTGADCPDKICEGMRKISGDGEIICCLPHRLFLTVRSDSSGEYDAVAY